MESVIRGRFSVEERDYGHEYSLAFDNCGDGADRRRYGGDNIEQNISASKVVRKLCSLANSIAVGEGLGLPLEMTRFTALTNALAQTFRRIRGEYDPKADRDNYGSSLQDVEKYLQEIEAQFPDIVRAEPLRAGELKNVDQDADQPQGSGGGIAGFGG